MNFFCVYKAGGQLMVEFALYENITDTELQKIFEEIQHTDQRLDYIKRYYTERKDEYEIRDFSSSDNKINGKIEVFKKRDIKNHEIDEALFFVNKGYDVTLLAEISVQSEKHIDALINHSSLVELRHVRTNKAKNIADEIKKAANKKNSEVISVFFIENSITVSKKTILKEIEKKKLKGDFTGTFNELLFVKNGTIDRIKNMAGLAEADTCHNPNIPWSNTIVNQKQEE